MTAHDNTAAGAADPGRRDFLKRSGAAAASVAFISLGAIGVAKGPAFPKMAAASGAIAVDPTLCIGCLSCEVACSDVHRDAGMSDVPRIRIYYRDSVQPQPELIKSFGNRGHFFQQVCVQCPDAPCVPVCPVDALHVDEKTGARVITKETCIACGKCEQACIFNAFDEAKAVGSDRYGQAKRITHDTKLNVFAKCDLCNFRAEGPACIQQCPVNVRIKQGVLKADNLCLDLSKPVEGNVFQQFAAQQMLPAGAKE